MDSTPVSQLEVENYGCIRRASFSLTPLHALVGPNDSGKSTALRALRTVAQFGAGVFENANEAPTPFNPMLDLATGGTKIALRYSDGFAYGVRTRDQHVFEEVTFGTAVIQSQMRGWNTPGFLYQESAPPVAELRRRISTATMVRFEPNALRMPFVQLRATDPIRFFDVTGLGLASVLQAINSRDVDGFVAIRDHARRYFPTIQSILVPTLRSTSDGTGNLVTLQARLTDNRVVPVEAMSEGLLYFLGFAALRYLDSRLFLVEEPENGLHPSRIRDVVNILREMSRTSQVIMATHSPLLVNELRGDEVSVVTRNAEGTHAQLLQETPKYEDRSRVYAPGELWVSYANGEDESPLLRGVPRQ